MCPSFCCFFLLLFFYELRKLSALITPLQWLSDASVFRMKQTDCVVIPRSINVHVIVQVCCLFCWLLVANIVIHWNQRPFYLQNLFNFCLHKVVLLSCINYCWQVHSCHDDSGWQNPRREAAVLLQQQRGWGQRQRGWGWRKQDYQGRGRQWAWDSPQRWRKRCQHRWLYNTGTHKDGDACLLMSDGVPGQQGYFR